MWDCKIKNRVLTSHKKKRWHKRECEHAWLTLHELSNGRNLQSEQLYSTFLCYLSLVGIPLSGPDTCQKRWAHLEPIFFFSQLWLLFLSIFLYLFSKIQNQYLKRNKLSPVRWHVVVGLKRHHQTDGVGALLPGRSSRCYPHLKTT